MKNSQRHKDTGIYTGSGHRCGVIPYSSVCGGLPLGLMMNNTREEQPPEVEVFLCSVCGQGLAKDQMPEAQLPPTVVASPIYRGPGPLPKCRQEGIPQRPISKGDN